MIKPKHTTQLPLGMLIPGYLDTRVPCGLPGFRPGSRETSDLPSYCDRLRQSTDCPCGHIQASTALAAAENAVLAHYRTRSMLSAASHPTSLQSSLVCRGPVVNWPARTQCTRLFTSVHGRNKRLYDCLWITSQQLSNATRHYLQRTREKRS